MLSAAGGLNSLVSSGSREGASPRLEPELAKGSDESEEMVKSKGKEAREKKERKRLYALPATPYQICRTLHSCRDMHVAWQGGGRLSVALYA